MEGTPNSGAVNTAKSASKDYAELFNASIPQIQNLLHPLHNDHENTSFTRNDTYYGHAPHHTDQRTLAYPIGHQYAGSNYHSNFEAVHQNKIVPYTPDYHAPHPYSTNHGTPNKQDTQRPDTSLVKTDTRTRGQKRCNVSSATDISTKRSKADNDEENFLIAWMRVKQYESWANIVDILNKKRQQAGQKPTLTDAAVYGRFKRNGSNLFQARGYEGFDPSDFMHIKKNGPRPSYASTTQHAVPFGTPFDPRPPQHGRLMQFSSGPHNPQMNPPSINANYQPQRGLFVNESSPSVTPNAIANAHDVGTAKHLDDTDADGDEDENEVDRKSYYDNHRPASGVPYGGLDSDELHRRFTYAMSVTLGSSTGAGDFEEVAAMLRDQGYDNTTAEGVVWYFKNTWLLGTPSAPGW